MEGFLKTDVGFIPNDWGFGRIDDFFTIQQGKSVSKANRVGDNQKPFLRTSNLRWGKVTLEELDYLHFTDAEEKKFKLQYNDLLVCEGGDIGRTAIWRNEMDGIYFQNHLHRVRAKVDDIDPVFVLNWMQYAFLYGKFYFGRANITTIPNLSKSRLSEFTIPKPPHPEQCKIAYVLSTIQKAIEQQEKLIQKTTELKKALMQKLFTEGTKGEPQKESEIGLIPESWEVTSISNEKTLMQYGTSVKCDYNISGYPVIRIPNVLSGKIDITDLKYGLPKSNEIEKLKLDKGDLVFVRTNGAKELSGRCSIFNNEIENCYYASYLIRVKFNLVEINPEFVNYYAQTEKGKSFLSGKANRTADGKYNINTGILNNVLFPKPKLDEQNEIVNIISLIENKVLIQLSKKKILTELFKTLLQELMTGKRRIHDIEFGNEVINAASIGTQKRTSQNT